VLVVERARFELSTSVSISDAHLRSVVIHKPFLQVLRHHLKHIEHTHTILPAVWAEAEILTYADVVHRVGVQVVEVVRILPER
jgi:hypothetical protein